MTKKLERKIDGTYTRLLRKVLGVKWYDFVKNEVLYENTVKVTEKIKRGE